MDESRCERCDLPLAFCVHGAPSGRAAPKGQRRTGRRKPVSQVPTRRRPDTATRPMFTAPYDLDSRVIDLVRGELDANPQLTQEEVEARLAARGVRPDRSQLRALLTYLGCPTGADVAQGRAYRAPRGPRVPKALPQKSAPLKLRGKSVAQRLDELKAPIRVVGARSPKRSLIDRRSRPEEGKGG